MLNKYTPIIGISCLILQSCATSEDRREALESRISAEDLQAMADSMKEQHKGRAMSPAHAILHGILQGTAIGSRR